MEIVMDIVCELMRKSWE